jgi:hypothetical protein
MASTWSSRESPYTRELGELVFFTNQDLYADYYFGCVEKIPPS